MGDEIEELAMTTSGQKKDLPGEKLFEMMECLGMEPTGAPEIGRAHV